MTVSTDGSVMWWDIRRLSEPVESMPLREKGSDTNLGGVVLEYDPAAGPTNFMVGTEQVRACVGVGVLWCMEFDPAAGPTNFMVGTRFVASAGRGGGRFRFTRHHHDEPVVL